MKPLLLLLALFLALPATAAVDPAPLDRIPVQEGGRKKPLAVFAEESLLMISGRPSVTVDGKAYDGMSFLAATWFDPAAWGGKPVILIGNLPLKRAIGVDERRKLFSRDELVANQPLIALLERASADQRAGRKLQGLPKEAAAVGGRIIALDNLRGGGSVNLVPDPRDANGKWTPLPFDDEGVTALRKAYLAGDNAAFVTAANTLRDRLVAVAPQFQPPAWKINLEASYRALHPFRWAWICYLAAGIVLAVTSMRGRKAGYAIGWTLAGVGLLFQLGGFVARVLVAGRPPVSNMYESVIWVAFGAVLLALVFEAMYRTRYFLLGATFAAVLPLLLADMQPMALSRSISPLQPILQSNFWLATHVLIITLSYAAFLVALAVGHISIGKAILGRQPSAALANYIYRSLQVGVLLLAVGTILGAVWANYSWGRFWDWDPKETWALIALLTYLIILHGRIAGAWAGFGLAVGAVLAFQTIIMAWYGVNFVLGVGLHSYGFGSGGLGYAITFVLLEVAFVAVGILRYRSLRAGSTVPLAAATASPGQV